jgi:hypothetical protein
MFILFLVLAGLLAAIGVYHLVPKTRAVTVSRGVRFVGCGFAAVSKPHLGVLFLVIAFVMALVTLLVHG